MVCTVVSISPDWMTNLLYYSALFFFYAMTYWCMCLCGLFACLCVHLCLCVFVCVFMGCLHVCVCVCGVVVGRAH